MPPLGRRRLASGAAAGKSRLRPTLLLVLLLSHQGCGDGGSKAPELDCAALSACREQGACSASLGQCIAAGDDDCRSRSEVCATWGLCAAVGGRCIAVADDGCRAASVCEIYGGCQVRDGRCVALSDADCAASSGCALYGWCSANLAGECVQIVP